MNAPFQPETIGLDQLELGTKALVSSIDWDVLDHGEACRLKHFGFDGRFSGTERAPRRPLKR